jgi:hypothetical protein
MSAEDLGFLVTWGALCLVWSVALLPPRFSARFFGGRPRNRRGVRLARFLSISPSFRGWWR